MASGNDPRGLHEDASRQSPEPYIGIAESRMVRFFVDPDHPNAAHRRKVIHRVHQFSVVWLGVVGLIIIALMVIGLIRG